MANNEKHESGKSSESEAGESTSPSKAELVRLKLKVVANYVLDGFPPVVAVIALIVAVFAINDNKSSQAQLAKAVVKIDSLSASVQTASKGELDKIKTAMAQEKLMYEEELKKQNERAALLIQSISKMQAKMKISPTLEEQMRQPAAVSVVTPITVKEISFSKEAEPKVVTPVIAPAAKVQAPPVKALVPAVKTPVTTVSTGADKKISAQVQTIKESIDQFNKK